MKSFREAKWFDIALWAFGFVLTAMIVVGVLTCDGGPREDSPAPENPVSDSVAHINEEEALSEIPVELRDTSGTSQPDSGITEKKGATS